MCQLVVSVKVTRFIPPQELKIGSLPLEVITRRLEDTVTEDSNVCVCVYVGGGTVICKVLSGVVR
jgi:hypothetical protein